MRQHYLQTPSAYKAKPSTLSMLMNGLMLILAVGGFAVFFLALFLGYPPKLCIFVCILALIAGYQTAKRLD